MAKLYIGNTAYKVMLGNNSGHIADLPTVVWNQGCKVSFNATIECYGVTLVWDTTTNSVILNGTATGTGYHDGDFDYGSFNTNQIANHKVYVRMISSDDNATLKPRATTGAGGMVVPNSDGTGKIGSGRKTNPNLNLSVVEGVTYNNVVVKVEYIDLTLMFGAGNEPTTVAQFEQWFTDNIGSLDDYYPYNKGKEIKVKYLPQYM